MNTLTNENLTGINDDGPQCNEPLKYLTALSIIGDKVHNENDEHMGKVEDIMINITTGNIEYLVIEFGGFLGMGIKYFAIPFGLFKIDPVNKIFIFNQKREMLENAPGFDLDQWPKTNFHSEETYWTFV